MARTVVVDKQAYKRRNIVAVWLGLPLITLGIYHAVWYYKVNNEARRYLRDNSIRPGIALLAVTLGVVLILPPFVSIYRTGTRVQRMQEQAGTRSRIEPALALILAFLGFHTLYIQSHLNNIWDLYLRNGGAAAGTGARALASGSTAPQIPPPTEIDHMSETGTAPEEPLSN